VTPNPDFQPWRDCSNCGAPWSELHDAKHDTFVCLRCGHIMALEGVPDSPGGLAL
jgi:DNA-directed RNA polymerase subunit RPC12/RpoP